jgi:hypothetical protein
MKITRTHLQTIISLSGLAVVLLTFIVKDARTDKLKGLVDSIEFAEDSFSVHSADHDVFAELRRFERDFYEFSHPKETKLSQVVAGGTVWPNPLVPDTVDLFKTMDEERQIRDMFLGVNRLANKIHVQQWQRDVLTSIKVHLDELHETCQKLNQEDMHSPTRNAEIVNALGFAFSISQDLDNVTSGILEDAEKERQRAEDDDHLWSIVYNCLYGLGSFLAAVGILMGVEGSAVEVPDS